jgi:Bacterial TniB protein
LTSITQLGRRFQVEFERRNPGVPDRIPVVYILIPPDADCKALTTELAVFLGLPVGYSDSPQALAHTVAALMRRAATRLVLVDELHRLDRSTKGQRGL